MQHPDPVVCGVYSLFKGRRLVYVGKSTNCYARIAGHRTNGREFDYALVTSCPEADIAWVEAALIAAWEPQQNRAGKAGAPGRPLALPVRHLHPVEDKPAYALPTDPLMLVAMGRAQAYATQYRLSGRFKEAVQAGELPVVDQGFRAGGRRRFVTVRDLREWCEGQQRARLKLVS